MKLQITKDTTNVTLLVFVQDSSSTTGNGLVGVTVSMLSAYFARVEDDNDVTVTQINLSDIVGTGTVHTDGGWEEISPNMPGWYRFDLPDAAFATSARSVGISLVDSGANDIAQVTIEVQLTDPGLSVTAVSNLEDQYDTTGLTGDTFPATQAQVGNIATGAGGLSALISAFAKVGAEPETNTFTATQQGDEVYHIVEDDGGNTDFYYQATVGAGAKATAFTWKGYVQSNGDSASVWYWDWVGTVYKQIDTLTGSNGTTPTEEVFLVPVGATGTGADQGKVRLRFLSMTTTAIATDRLLCEFTQASQSVGYANGQIWVDENSSNTNTVSFVDGVADNVVGSWANAITISGQVGLTDFHVINGSTIALTGTSNNFSVFGDNWTLQLESRSVDGSYFQGAHVSGIGTSATEVHFEGCDVATASVQNGHFDFCSFSGTVTHTLAGDYNYHNCYSDVPGSGGPTFAKTAGQAITAQWRGWKGSINLTGLEVGDTLTIGGTELGTIDLGSPAGAVVVEIRGIYKDLVNIGSASVNLDGAINAADVALTLADTNELQTDNVPGLIAALNDPTATAIADAVWDEVISTSAHNTAQSAGRRLRQVTSVIIANDDAEVSNSPGANQIQLASTESSVDGMFDPGIVGIIGGTGFGQCRLILEYNGTTKIATLNRDWKVVPDVTSEYIILCSEGGMHVNEGLAQGGGVTSITLNSLASSTNNVYNGQLVFLVSGTGQDQVGRVTAYNGTTKVATIETTANGWAITPDSTTGYTMLPIIDLSPTIIGTPVALDSGTATISGMLTKMADNNNGADFVASTDSLEAIRNRGDAAWITATSVTVSDKTGFKLASDGLGPVIAWTVDITGNLSGSVGSVASTVVTDAASRTASKATGFAVAGDAMALTAGERATLADVILVRAVQNVEDSADKHSLGALIMFVTNWSISGATLTAKKPSSDSVFNTYALSTTADVDPVTGVS